MSNARRFVFCALLVLQSCNIASAGPQLQDGDLIFQELPHGQGRAIKEVTRSRYTHVGMIFIDDGQPMVYEAVQPVKITTLRRFVRRGKNGHYVVKRLKNAGQVLGPAAVSKLRETAMGFMGRDYDSMFHWSDDRIYCSEFTWKVYERALGLEIGSPQRWKDLDVSGPAARRLMRRRLTEPLDLEGMVITPERMFRSSKLTTVSTVGK